MAFINDPDQLTSTEVAVDVNARTFTLNAAGNLAGGGATASDNGVTGQALHSYFKEQWRNCTQYGPGAPTDFDYLIIHPYPVLPLTKEQYEFGNNGSQFNGWGPANDATRQFIRTAGWAEYDAAGGLLREYAGVVTLGGPETDDQVYYENIVGTPTNMIYPGPVNEAVQIYGDATNGNFTRKTIFNIFGREYAQNFNASSIGDIGVSTLETIVNRFPLATGANNDIINTDIQLDPNSDGSVVDSVIDSAIYAGMTITYYNTPQAKLIDGVSKDFHVIIEANGASVQQVYTFVQFMQRQDLDIDAGATHTINGKTSNSLLYFNGSELRTNYVDEAAQATSVTGGVFIENIDANDKISIAFSDDTNTTNDPANLIRYNFVAAGNFVNNVNLTDDAAGKYWAFYRWTNSTSATDVDVSAPSGAQATLGSTTLDFSVLTAGDQFIIEGFTNPENNGVWEATGTPTANAVTANKIRDEDGVNNTNPSIEAATPSVTFKENPYGTTSAIIVKDSSDTDITGTISAAGSIGWDYAYDTNNQGGRPIGDAACVAVAIGLTDAQVVQANFTIARTTGITVPLNANKERVYLNA